MEAIFSHIYATFFSLSYKYSILSVFSFFDPFYTEGVGKSSLISTFVSRYFSEPGVPGIMTRVRLPPDPHSLCITTIVDSQAGDVALQQQYQYQQQQQQQPPFSDITATTRVEPPSSTSLSPPETAPSSSLLVDNVDSIVLVYDLDRTETFARLENHWLPLIERCYEGKVRQYLNVIYPPIFFIGFLIMHRNLSFIFFAI